MHTSDEINSLATALARAQGELKNIEKGKVNKHFNNSYADIADGLEVIRPVLSKHGLAIVQSTEVNQDTGFFVLVTRIIHSSGQWVQSTYPLPTSGKAQEIGSAITYARRYALFSLVGVAGTNEDDDGNAAQSATPQKPVRAKAPGASEELVKAATDEASKGTESLRTWWTDQPQNDRASFSPAQVSMLKELAAKADKTAKEEVTE